MTWSNITVNPTTGNVSIFIAADPIVISGTGNNVDEVDFNNTFSTENPWRFSTTATVTLTGTNRNDPV